MTRLLGILLIFTLGVARAEESPKDAVFRRGNEASLHGRYDEASAAYEQVVALGIHSIDLYFNLGNAYFRANHLGSAICNYERALELDPQNEDVQFNLKAAREVVKKRGEDRLVGAEEAPFWIRAASSYTLGLVSWLFLLSYLVLFGLLIAQQFITPGFLRIGLRSAIAFLALGALGSGALVAGRLYMAAEVEQAIILDDSVQVKDGPDASDHSSFSVHAGLRVRIVDREHGWFRLRLANGLEGWVQNKSVGKL